MKLQFSLVPLTLAFALALGSVSSVLASPFTTVFEVNNEGSNITERVPSIVVKNLDAHKGKYLKAYYVVGRSQFLDQQTQIRVLELKRIDMIQINNDEITLPSALIVKKSIFAAYNYVILVVTNDAGYTLLNPDGTIVDGQGDAKVGDGSALKIAISKDDLLQPSIAAGVYTPGEAVPENLIPFEVRF